MAFERSAGAIIFHLDDDGIKYLLLHYPSITHRSKRDYWDFAKGHVDKGESELETVVRETVEETGINDLEFIDGFRETMKYFFRYKNKLIFKVVSFRLARTRSESVTLSGEHDDFIWLSYADACRILSFTNARGVMTKANEFLEKNVRPEKNN
jgi:bis(5'-nucleosidyl)-tetraphosphatase